MIQNKVSDWFADYGEIIYEEKFEKMEEKTPDEMEMAEKDT
tara:strand:- start:2106 stop:2228 length:123 start_codon:yes stop_codon:yes gene_type:complete